MAPRMVLDSLETTSDTDPMPGHHITDRQVVRYMSLRPHHPQATASAKAGFSERSARRIDSDPRLPSQTATAWLSVFHESPRPARWTR